MEDQLQFDFTEAREARDDGIKRAADHAEATEPGWNGFAYKLLLTFIQTNETFMTEDFREWAHKQGLPIPPDSRSFGSIITRAVKAGLITRKGYAPMKSVNCHMNPKSVWVVI